MVMIFGTMSPAFAAGFDGSNEPVQKTESELISKNGKLIAKLVVPKKAKVQKRSTVPFGGPAKAPTFDQTTVKVNIAKHGIGSNPFNFDAIFGPGASKKITLTNDADGSSQEVTFTSSDTSVQFTTPIPMADIVNGDAYIEFEGGNVAGKLTWEESDPNYSGASNVTTFTLDLYQVKNTDVVVKTKTADGTVVANPTTAATNGKIKLGSMNIEKDIPAQGATLTLVDHIRVKDVNTLNGEPNYSVEGLENGVLVDKTANKVYRPGNFVIDPTGIAATTLEFTEKPLVTTDDMSGDTDYVKVTFAQGDHGTIAADATKEYYVFKGVTMASTLTAPAVTANTGWTQKTGAEAWNPSLATKYDAATEHVAQYKYNGPDVVPQNPGEDKPNVPDNFVKVDFSAGDHGTIAADQTTIYWVNPTAGKTLADVTKPTVTANDGWKFTGWDKADTTAITGALTVTGTFTKLTGTNDSDKYDPKGKEITVNVGGTPNAEDGISNKGDLPSGTNYKFKNPVDTSTQGTKDATIIVTYPDQTTDTVNVKVIVKDKTTPTPEGPSVTYPETSIDKGDTKTITPDIKDKDGNPTTTNDIPEVVQPGNGVVVTPHTGGKITVTIPEDYDGPSTIVIPVEVTIGGEKVKTNLIIRVNDDKPVIDYDIPELKIHEYTPTYPVYTSIEKKVVEVKDKEVINSHDQYIFGYPDDTIRPDGDMTRAEAIAVVARLQKLDLSDKSSKIYKDTKADMWYNGAINAAFREGYLLEKEGENIRPNDKITRAELAELISHIDKKNNSLAPFDDVKGHKFEAAINQAYGNERIKGYPDGTFKPDNFITRAEVATMLNKLYDRYPDKNFIDANQNLVHNYKDMSYKGHWGYYELVEAYHSHTYLRLKDNMEEWKVIIK